MNKTIAIDCFKLIKGEGASIGIYNYTKNFVENLTTLNKYNIIIFGNEKNRNDFDINGVKFINITFKYRNKITYILWELFFVNYFIWKNNISLCIFPRGYIPLFKISKTINIIHDLIPMYYYKNYKEDVNFLENFYIRKRLLSSIKNSTETICISEYTKKEILEFFPNKSNSLKVIYNGYNKLTNSRNEKLENVNHYIMAVSSSKYKHKNLKDILGAYTHYFKNTKTPMKLYLLGVKDFINYEIEEEVKNNIILTGYLSDEEYIQTLKNAKVFLFLSLIEGFGFPPLEAMNLNTPVICSNKTSLKEVVLEGGVLLNPKNYSKIAEEINSIVNDTDYENILIKKGAENLKRFEWKSIIYQYDKEINNILTKERI